MDIRNQTGRTTEHASSSDRQLMARLKEGDMSALEEIYMRYGFMVKTAIHRVSPSVIPADVEELTQDVFLALCQSASRFNDTKELKPWLYGISVNKAAGFKRSGWLHRNLLRRHISDTRSFWSQNGNASLRQVEVREELIQAFKSLPRDQHEVMVLHVVEGFKGEDIAEILGVEVNTVWTRLHRARKTLMKHRAETEKKAGKP